MRFLVPLALFAVVPSMLVAQPTRAAAAQPPICRGCDSLQRVAAARRTADLQLATLMTRHARENFLIETLKLRLADGSPDPPATDRERRDLQNRLGAARAALARTQAEIEATCSTVGSGRGYIGLRVLASTSVSAGPVPAPSYYPVVWGVEPGSPASRAGVQPMDTIVAVNGVDARSRSLETVIRHPGRRITLKLQGAGTSREVTFAVDSNPPSLGGACVHSIGPSGLSSRIVLQLDSVRRPSAVAAGGSGSGASGSAAGRGATVRTGTSGRVLVRPDSIGQITDFTVYRGGSVSLSRGPEATIAGAQVFILNEGLKRAFSVTVDGALVLQVLPRTPAFNAGLASGDVIVRAAGRPVTTVEVFRRTVEAATGRSVELETIRAGAPRKVTLRW
jgi:S1-C subfamily serine protease